MIWQKHGIHRLVNTKPSKTNYESETPLGQDKSKVSASLKRDNSFRKEKILNKSEPCERSRKKSEKTLHESVAKGNSEQAVETRAHFGVPSVHWDAVRHGAFGVS